MDGLNGRTVISLKPILPPQCTPKMLCYPHKVMSWALYNTYCSHFLFLENLLLVASKSWNIYQLFYRIATLWMITMHSASSLMCELLPFGCFSSVGTKRAKLSYSKTSNNFYPNHIWGTKFTSHCHYGINADFSYCYPYVVLVHQCLFFFSVSFDVSELFILPSLVFFYSSYMHHSCFKYGYCKFCADLLLIVIYARMHRNSKYYN